VSPTEGATRCPPSPPLQRHCCCLPYSFICSRLQP